MTRYRCTPCLIRPLALEEAHAPANLLGNQVAQIAA